MKNALVSIFAFLLMIIITSFQSNAITIAPQLDDIYILNGALGEVDTFETASEGQLFSFIRSTGYSDSQDLEIRPLAPLPDDSTFPTVRTTSEASSTFTWNTDYCDAVSNYLVDIEYYNHTFGIPGLPWFTETVHLTVNNANRAPIVNTDAASALYVPLGQSVQMTITASDPDELECTGDVNPDNITDMDYAFDPIKLASDATFQPAGYGLAEFDWIPDEYDLGITTLVFSADDENNGTGSINTTVNVYRCGDTNGNGVVTSADIIYLVNHIFKSGPAPLPTALAGDVNDDGVLTSQDIIYLVNYVFKSGPAPCA